MVMVMTIMMVIMISFQSIDWKIFYYHPRWRRSNTFGRIC